MMAAAALVVLGIILVVLGILADGSLPLIGIGIVALVAAGIMQTIGARKG